MGRSYPAEREGYPNPDSYRYRHRTLAETDTVESLEACMAYDSAMKLGPGMMDRIHRHN